MTNNQQKFQARTTITFVNDSVRYAIYFNELMSFSKGDTIHLASNHMPIPMGDYVVSRGVYNHVDRDSNFIDRYLSAQFVK